MKAAATIAWRDFRSAHGLPSTWFFHAGFVLLSGMLFIWLVGNFSDTSELARASASTAPDLAGQLNIDVGVVRPLVG